MVEKKIFLFMVVVLMFFSSCYAIEYNWTLTNGITLSNQNSFTGSFTIPGKYVLILIASIGELKASKDMTFYIAYEDGSYCIDGQSWLINDESNPLISSDNDCYKSNGFNRIYCCERGKLCTDEGDEDWVCSDIVNTNYVSCVDYTDPEQCNNDIYGVAEYSIEQKVENENFCGSIINVTGMDNYIYASRCSCVWDESSQICISSWDESTYDSSGTILGYGTCELTTTKVVGDCSKDKFRIEYMSGVWTGTSDRPSDCPENLEQKISCGGVVSLDFFSWITFFVSLILILVIYVIFLKNKKK